ncbi:hypothetical protein FGADI_2667 [Fusarium gaditjirri]|uniref:Uncharacterized protein n=1 Tax=Fusarium gaditjirri TaxID=282569 RepID=A0A8H4THY8_9HYPO|nr:hypothetical protein FGADI_2667 [Fusarium gaditjirri]
MGQDGRGDAALDEIDGLVELGCEGQRQAKLTLRVEGRLVVVAELGSLSLPPESLAKASFDSRQLQDVARKGMFKDLQHLLLEKAGFHLASVFPECRR